MRLTNSEIVEIYMCIYILYMCVCGWVCVCLRACVCACVRIVFYIKLKSMYTHSWTWLKDGLWRKDNENKIKHYLKSYLTQNKCIYYFFSFKSIHLHWPSPCLSNKLNHVLRQTQHVLLLRHIPYQLSCPLTAGFEVLL